VGNSVAARNQLKYPVKDVQIEHASKKNENLIYQQSVDYFESPNRRDVICDICRASAQRSH